MSGYQLLPDEKSAASKQAAATARRSSTGGPSGDSASMMSAMTVGGVLLALAALAIGIAGLVVATTRQPSVGCPVNTCRASNRTCTRVDCVMLNGVDRTCVESAIPSCTSRERMPYEICDSNGHCAVDGEASDYRHYRTVHTMDANEVMNLMLRIHAAFFANDTASIISIPELNWSGNDIVRASEQLPTRTIRPGTMTGSEFGQVLQSLSLQLFRSLDHTTRAFDGEMNADQAGSAYEDARMVPLLQSCIDLVGGVYQRVQNLTGAATINGKPIGFSEAVGFPLIVNVFTSVRDYYTNSEIYQPSMTWGAFYYGPRSKNVAFEYHGNSDNGYDDQDVFSYWFPFLLSYWSRLDSPRDPSAAFFERLYLIPQIVRVSAGVWEKRAEYEELAASTSFYVNYFYRDGSKIFTDATDPEGVAAQSDQEREWRSNPTKAHLLPYLPPTPGQPDNSVYANFTSMNLTDANGDNSAAYIGTDAHAASFYTTPEYLEAALGVAEGQRLLKKIAYAYDVYLRPQRIRYAKALLARTQPGVTIDDHYTGRWRLHLQYVTRVIRNTTTGLAISIDVPLDPINDPSGVNMTVPLDASKNTLYATTQSSLLGKTVAQLTRRFVGVQQKIAAAESWLDASLEMSIGSHVGDEYLVLRKNASSRFGYYAGATPFSGIRDVRLDYLANIQTVAPYGQPNDLRELVYNGGNALTQIFYDVKQYYGDRVIKDNFAAFNFSSSTAAGLNKINSNGVNVTLSFALTYSKGYFAEPSAVSDVEYLGRHYGYTVTGAVNTSEPYPPPLYTCYSATYYPFDYIYREHYGYNKMAPMTPSNIIDPVKQRTKYRFTDTDDRARYDEYIAYWSRLEATSSGRLRRGRCGTYLRWRMDWVMQKMGKFVIDRMVQDGLMEAMFAYEYWGSTFVDLNNATDVASKGPVRACYRAVGIQGSGPGWSGSFIDTTRMFSNSSVGTGTTIPFHIAGSMGIMMHESSMGHSFQYLLSNVAFLRGTRKDISWTGNLITNYLYDDSGGYWYNSVPTPLNGAVVEGWATLTELLAGEAGYYPKFDAAGQPIVGTFDSTAALYGIIALSRIAARQVTAVGYLYSRYAWSFNRAVTTFKDLTGFETADMVDFIDRFLKSPMQQTSYAAGFSTNVGAISYLTQQLQSQNDTFCISKFIRLRLEKTSYLLGSPLINLATQNSASFSCSAPEEARRKRMTSAQWAEVEERVQRVADFEYDKERHKVFAAKPRLNRFRQHAD